METEKAALYDLLLPVELPPEANFVGKSGREPHAFNNETGFNFGVYQASFHTCGGKRYVLIRLAKSREAIEVELLDLRRRIARASVSLDLSIRAQEGGLHVLGSGEPADLDFVHIFPAGEMPRVAAGEESLTFQVDVSVLSAALAKAPPPLDIERAAQMFTDVDFEESSESRYVLLSTILELLAKRQDRDVEALNMIECWSKEAEAAGRADLVQALKGMRAESIGSAISRLVTEAATRAGCNKAEIEQARKQARTAYGKRGALLHGGAPISTTQLSSLRSIVRLVLTGERTPTFFTSIGNRHWVEKRRTREPLRLKEN